LESGLGSRPRGFESRILRQLETGSDLRKRCSGQSGLGTASHQTPKQLVSVLVSISGRRFAETQPSDV
jgi:hypothetical protein